MSSQKASQSSEAYDMKKLAEASREASKEESTFIVRSANDLKMMGVRRQLLKGRF